MAHRNQSLQAISSSCSKDLLDEKPINGKVLQWYSCNLRHQFFERFEEMFDPVTIPLVDPNNIDISYWLTDVLNYIYQLCQVKWLIPGQVTGKRVASWPAASPPSNSAASVSVNNSSTLCQVVNSGHLPSAIWNVQMHSHAGWEADNEIGLSHCQISKTRTSDQH